MEASTCSSENPGTHDSEAELEVQADGDLQGMDPGMQGFEQKHGCEVHVKGILAGKSAGNHELEDELEVRTQDSFEGKNAGTHEREAELAAQVTNDATHELETTLVMQVNDSFED